MTGQQDEKEKDRYFLKVREQLRYWPHTLHQIDDTLDIGLIEGKGRQIVYQALNARNLTAFAGSGLSAAYGRMNWGEWESEHLGIVDRNAKDFLNLCKESQRQLEVIYAIIDYRKRPKGWQGPPEIGETVPQEHRHAMWRWVDSMKMTVIAARQDVKRLCQTFEHCKSKGEGFVGGDGTTVRFDVLKQLHDAVESYCHIFLGRGPRTELLDDSQRLQELFWPGAHVTDNPGTVPMAAKKVHDVIGNVAEVREGYKKFDEAHRKFVAAMSRPLARDPLELQAKRILSSECGHALSILRAGLLKGGKTVYPYNSGYEALENQLTFPAPEDLKRAFPSMRDKPENYRVLAPFLRSSFLALQRRSMSQTTRPGWAGIDTLTRDYFSASTTQEEKQKRDQENKRRFLSPSLRFLVGAYLCLLDKPKDWLLTSRNRSTKQAFPEIEPHHFTSRRSIIDEGLDPLERIIGGLGIRRFITTNYDFEIERAFLDRGFRRFPRHEPSELRTAPQAPGPTDFAADAVGSILRDQTFTRERASDLISFGIGDPGAEASVFHLHGRATLEDRLVITERDYMDLYLMEDAHRETVHDAITMAFSASPVLFLGLGLTELDLLRPLRQFMANRDRTLGFNAVALMPAFKPVEERTKFATSVYQRYGVHTIYYGGGLVKVATADRTGDDNGERDLDWLCRVTLLIDGLKKHVEDAEKHLKKDGAQPFEEDALGDLMRKVGSVGSDLRGYREPLSDKKEATNPSALFVLLGSEDIGVDEDKSETEWATKARKHIEENCPPRIRFCTFTPVRGRPENVESRHFNRDAHVAAEKYLEFPVNLLSGIFNLLVVTKTTWTSTDEDKSELAALRLMLDGLKGAILTGALNAALEGLESGWRVWWRNWQQPPPHRVARFEHDDWTDNNTPVRFIRHRVDNVLGPSSSSWHIPVTEPAPTASVARGLRSDPARTTGVRTFDTFIEAISSNLVVAPKGNTRPDPGRVMFTVLAHRGLGKGTFVSAFSSPRGLSLYEQEFWGRQAGGPYSRRMADSFLLGAIFINFSFATEVASNFDMLLDTLIDAHSIVRENSGKSRQELRSALRWLQKRRDVPPPMPPKNDKDDPETMRSFERASKEFEDARDEVDTSRQPIQKRLNNLPRLEALREAMREYHKAAMDCRSSSGLPRILICMSSLDVLYDSQRCPKNPEIEAFLNWLTGSEMENAPVDLVFISSESRLGAPFLDEKTPAAPQLCRMRLDRTPLSPEGDVYVRKRLSGGNVRLDVKDFEAEKQVRLLIAGDTDPDKPEWRRSRTNFLHVVRPFNAVGLMLDNFKVLATGLWLDELLRIQSDQRLIDVRSIFNEAVRSGRKASDTMTERLWAGTDVPKASELSDARGLVWDEVAKKLEAVGWIHKDEIEDPLRAKQEQLTEIARKTHADMRLARHYLHENRYLLTILLAAAQNGIVLADDPMQGAREARQFINATLDKARNVGGDEVEEVVVRAVLAYYQTRHQIGDPDRDMELHGLVLRHLGVIGAPVQVDALVRLPEFRDYFDQRQIELPTSRRRFLARALTVMAHRGLVFRLSPQPRQVILETGTGEDEEWPIKERYRYVLHRIMQRHVLSRLRVGTKDAIEQSRFTPTLYAAMPSPSEGLSTEGYNFIRSLSVGLSQYPDIPRGDDRLRPWLFTTNKPNIRIQALRLALSLSRSTLSLPIFAALDGQTNALIGSAKRGFLDTYKVRLRWLIRFSWEMASQRKRVQGQRMPLTHHDESTAFPHLNALYRDEIVWLHNEVGMISLAQGNLTEALGYLRLGVEYNEKIEGPARRGPIGDRLVLNYAAVQIERGRINAAERHLKRVKADSEIGSLERSVSDGYLCLIDDLRGHKEGLQRRFKKVVADLEKRGEARAQALFLLHSARATYRDDPDEGLMLIERAYVVASSDGQEDLRNRIELSRVAIERRVHKGKDRESEWSRRLITIENYGKRMGIWSLQVDALRLRAEQLLMFGESGSAGQLLVRSIAIAQRNRMMLRLNGAVRLYADALLLRGEILAAFEMAQESLKLARRLGYSLEEKKSSDVLARIQAKTDINLIKVTRFPI